MEEEHGVRVPSIQSPVPSAGSHARSPKSTISSQESGNPRGFGGPNDRASQLQNQQTTGLDAWHVARQRRGVDGQTSDDWQHPADSHNKRVIQTNPFIWPKPERQQPVGHEDGPLVQPRDTRIHRVHPDDADLHGRTHHSTSHHREHYESDGVEGAELGRQDAHRVREFSSAPHLRGQPEVPVFARHAPAGYGQFGSNPVL